VRKLIHAVQHRLIGIMGVSKSFIIEDQEVVLVDTGFSKGSARRIIGAFNGLWKSPEEVALCVITHRHADHVGGLGFLKGTCKFKVAAHKDEADAITEKTGVEVDIAVEDRDVLPECGGIEVVHVPGHTAGNICLLVEGSLIAGDALRSRRGKLRPPSSRFSEDPAEALKGLSRLESLDFDAIYVSHGDDLITGGKEELASLLGRIRNAY
jgi:glyoxylase-like metal-dependent hydrolase (beta-lactamase superfamily II)